MLRKLSLSILTGLLLYAGWPPEGNPLLVFIGFVPLLFLEREFIPSSGSRGYLKLFLYSYLSFAIWNLATTWWLANASGYALAAVVILNSALMALVMPLFRFVKNKLGLQRGYISLPVLWISMESLHKYIDIEFPWLHLGNAFATNVEWIQWYEHVGAFGGSLWIWVVNLSLFGSCYRPLAEKAYKKMILRISFIVVLLLVIPIWLSYRRYLSYHEKGPEAQVVVVQNNVDTYQDKFTVNEATQVHKFLAIAETGVTGQTDFVLGAETVLHSGIFLDKLAENNLIDTLQGFVNQYPGTGLILGAMTFERYNGPYTPTARPLKQDTYYDVFNSALFIDANHNISVRHKAKLVAGAEKMPYRDILQPVFGELSARLGGIRGSLGKPVKQALFVSEDGVFHIAPLICWESDFGEYVTRYVRMGANFIFIMSNDDWWGNTPGIYQHMHYSRLRAVENRRSVARAANTGISCFINQRGDVIKSVKYGEEAAISESLNANTGLTYYSRSGDVVSRVSYFISAFLLLFSLVKGYLRKRDSKL